MASIKLWPHQLADERFIDFSPWRWSITDLWSEIESGVEGWNPDSDLQLKCTYSADLTGLIDSAGLGPIVDLRIISIADCPATRNRQKVITLLSQSSTGEIFIDVPRGSMTGRVTLEHHLIDFGLSEDDVQPTGRRLLDPYDETILMLDENPNAFPTDALSFKDAGFDPLDWIVDIRSDYDSLWNSLFRETVSLWINTDGLHCNAILKPSEPNHNLFRTLIERDIVWNLFTAVAIESGPLDATSAGEESVGRVLSTICMSQLNVGLDQFMDIVRFDPINAKRIIDSCIKLPKVGVK